MGGIDAKTGAPPSAPGSIHETSIGDISKGAKQNFPQDPISSGIGGTGIGAHSSHGASSYGGMLLPTSAQGPLHTSCPDTESFGLAVTFSDAGRLFPTVCSVRCLSTEEYNLRPDT